MDTPKLIDIDRKIENNPRYKRLLNNLLGIASRDQAVRVSSKPNTKDLMSILSQDNFEKIINNAKFKVSLSNLADLEMIKNLSDAQNSDEFIRVTNDAGMILSMSDRKLLAESFSEEKNAIITKILKHKNKQIAIWKKYRNNYLDKHSQTNSWPLYIGHCFVKVKTVRTTLYAPLILKKVELEISANNKVYIKSLDDSLEINDKLAFLLQDIYKFNVPSLEEYSNLSISQAMKIIKETFRDIFSNSEVDVYGKFNFLTRNEIINPDLRFDQGTVLFIANPSGGKLREKLTNILLEGSIDDLLDIDPTVDIKKDAINELSSGQAIYRIVETDLSQEKAIMGSLSDSSIIWGPPGTGKSQTISNIIANLMMKEKSVIVTSEKKAALDIIKKRMGKLNKYIFFGLIDKNINKEEFYKPLKELIRNIRNNPSSNWKSRSSYITKADIEYTEAKNNLRSEDIDALKWVSNYKVDHTLITNVISNKAKFSKVLPLQQDESITVKFDNLGIKKKGFIFHKYPEPFESLRRLSNKLCAANINKICRIKEIKNFENFNSYKSAAVEFNKQKRNFINDIDYIDWIMTKKFEKSLEEQLHSNDANYKKRVKSFIKNCESGFRIPYKFISLYKDILMNIFNVFVSTPNILAATINLDLKYDYAIFDEASQLHLEKALPFISIAKKSIIAGDSQQMKPTSYFGIRDNEFNEEDNEEDVDSLLDYANRKGLSPSREYMLSKNYRSRLAELMLFSSKEFYHSQLDVIDNYGENKSKAIQVYDVDGKWETRVNYKEATFALDLLLEKITEFGSIILLTLNSSQMQYINNLIYSNEKYSIIIKKLDDDSVVLRNLENIQGDEADLVIVSVAYDKTTQLGSTYVAKPEGRNALNVAISRARSKIIVIKSIKSSEIVNITNDSMDTFKKWLSYIESPKAKRLNYLSLNGLVHNHEFDPKASKFDSKFEEHVCTFLKKYLKVNREVNVESQFPVGSYKINQAIMDSKTMKFILGIEIDDYKYHTDPDKMIKDIERQKFIETKGYPIYRILEINWKINKYKIIEDIKKLINSYLTDMKL